MFGNRRNGGNNQGMRNRNAQVEGSGNGRNNGGACGPGGYCVCAKCGEKIVHERGVRCTSLKCPKCGNTMVREELLKK